MKRHRHWVIGVALFVVTMGLYWPATGFPFVNFDDPAYVCDNPHVLPGVSAKGLRWDLTSNVQGNWHPVTMFSHQLDCSLYGDFAGGQHFTNILLHAINALLLLFLLTRLTGMFWPAALVAALFAWHPLNVESVSWIAERKNVLCTTFFLLAIWAYWRYTQNLRSSRFIAYGLSLLLFVLGLASKAMLVTLPCLLLLLDYWPLRRISLSGHWRQLLRQRGTWMLLLEKVPFLVLAAMDCWITYDLQQQAGAVRSFSADPLGLRLMNVPVAYVTYLAKTVWPTGLTIFYPFPVSDRWGLVLAAAGLLVFGTGFAWHWRTKFPWFIVGWLWFLGTLVPVIGLVQVGGQAMADRYAYQSLIGIFLIVAWAFHRCWPSQPAPRVYASTGVALCLGLCLVVSGYQLTFWRSSVSLFERVVDLSPKSGAAHSLLGDAYEFEGMKTNALAQYEIAVRLCPEEPEFNRKLGLELIRNQKYSRAQTYLAQALSAEPDNATYLNDYGVSLMLGGEPNQAARQFKRAITLNPDIPDAYFNLGKILLSKGRAQTAITNFMRALQLNPDWIEAADDMAQSYAAVGDTTRALETAKRALKMAETDQDYPAANQIAKEIRQDKIVLATSSAIPQKQ